jgi:UDP-N-acetylglucosamine:LPS N-acetylglucosamine transferase
LTNAARPTVLILTTQTGGGHLNLAHALKDMLEACYEVVIEDAQPESYGSFYAQVSQHYVSFLTWQFMCTDNKIASYCLHNVLAALSRRRLLAIIERIQPRLIIATHAFLSYAVAQANAGRRERVPLVFQLTDLGRLHRTWFTEKGADAYLAPTHEIYDQAVKQGIAKNRLHLTGRPVRGQFREVSAALREAALAELGLDPARFTVFLQGGAQGSAEVDRTVEGLLRTDAPPQIILAVGNNRGMAARYAGIQGLRPLPFTRAIAPYMAAADVIAGKAGASFISEAFMLEKPFLVTAYIPGQETHNLQFIERHNLGWICLETAAQQELLSRVAGDPALLAEKVAAIRAYRAWNMQANQQIGSIIAQLIDGHESA